LSDMEERLLEERQGIAIVGMAGRFPGAPDLDRFWSNLREGVESVRAFTAEELLGAGIPPARLADPTYVRARPVLDGVELFDASFFGFTPREAETTDPQHRLFLECAWEALEDAGCDSETWPGAIGVFGGGGVSSYLLYNLAPRRDLLAALGAEALVLGNRVDNLTTRAAYKLNLRGPAVTIQTSCSTSLVAVHLACQSLLNGECDLALAGGVSLTVPAKLPYLYYEGGLLSPDGHCRAFDERAAGTVAGSGVGIVALKRLDDALADRDAVRAVIRGSAANNDGSLRLGYTAPGVQGQAQVLRAALAVSEVDPRTVGFVEAHGSGTRVGDPIEVAALAEVYGAAGEDRQRCALGSIKTNIGHLDAAAGVAGLIKAVLALERGVIPPTLHFERANPGIDFERTPFFVNTRPLAWRSGNGPRRAAVSSFGLGGTNAHLILEEPPPAPAEAPARAWQLLTLSAASAAALEKVTGNLLAHLRGGGAALAHAPVTPHTRRGVLYTKPIPP
jgi:acyl transferase domain-containing protein